MTREEAIVYLKCADTTVGREIKTKTAEALEMAIKALEQEPRWIPVSERLPKDWEYVLLTVRRMKDAYNHLSFISIGHIGWNQQSWWCAHDGDCDANHVEVLAWMPLPKQYEPQESDGKE